MIEDIENAYKQVQYQYPRNMTELLKFLVKQKQDHRNLVHIVKTHHRSITREVAFINIYGKIKDLTGTDMMLVSGRDGI